jgi:hypothetical protein
VPPVEPQSEGDRPSGSTSSLPPLPSSKGHQSQGSSSSSRGRFPLALEVGALEACEPRTGVERPLEELEDPRD